MPLALCRPRSVRARLWQGAGIVAALLAGALIATAMLPRESAIEGSTLGHDFVAFYTAGSFVNAGHPGLYDLEAAQAFQRSLEARQGIDLGGEFGPYWNPPWFAAAAAPLARLGFHDALQVWMGLNITALGLAGGLLARLLRPLGWRTAALAPVLMLLSFPAVQALTHGQNTPLSLLLLSGLVLVWRGGHGAMAGALCGVLAYKPQLAALLAVAVVATLGRRAALGLLASGAAWVALSEWTTPGAIGQWLAWLPLNLERIQTADGYLWDRHVTLRAFWRMLLQGREAGAALPLGSVLTWSTSLLLGVGLMVAWRATRRGGRDGFIAATIVAMPLVMPFYFDYDLLLLAAPATLLAASGAASRGLRRAWIGLFVATWVNPWVASSWGFNLTVPALLCVAAMTLSHACHAGATDSASGAGGAPDGAAAPARGTMPAAA